jgi:hypothetical protein
MHLVCLSRANARLHAGVMDTRWLAQVGKRALRLGSGMRGRAWLYIPADRMRGAKPPSISQAPPKFGSMEMERTVPPVRIAFDLIIK